MVIDLLLDWVKRARPGLRLRHQPTTLTWTSSN